MPDINSVNNKKISLNIFNAKKDIQTISFDNSKIYCEEIEIGRLIQSQQNPLLETEEMRTYYCVICGSAERPLYKFPSKESSKKKWCDAANITPEKLRATSKVCKRHFCENQFVNIRLKANAVPCLYLKKGKYFLLIATNKKLCLSIAIYLNIIQQNPIL